MEDTPSVLARIFTGYSTIFFFFSSMAAVLSGYFVFSWAGRQEGIDFFRNRAV